MTIIVMFHKLCVLFRKRSSRIVLCILLGILFVSTFFGSNNYLGVKESFHQVREEEDLSTHFAVINDFVTDREKWVTSALGALLFKYEANVTPQNKTFTILVWKYLDKLSARHINRFGRKSHDPLEDCSVKNCIFTGEDDKLATVDAVVVHLQRGVIPQVEHRDPKQRWIFLNDESPRNVFSLAKRTPSIKVLENVFNWSMTYRSDADIPVPYGRTVALHEPIILSTDTSSITELIPNWKKKRRDVLATILMSNCRVKFRMNFIGILQEYIQIDMFGGCATNDTNKHRCPGHFRSDCEPISEYLFYLAIENSNCYEYLTEKIWYHAYEKGAIPIIMGPTLSDCERLLPPNSFIHVPVEYNTADIEKLVRHITMLSADDNALVSLHKWRNHFEVLNEHGYFGSPSYHLCRICEAMNYNDVAEKVYTEKDLKQFLDPELMCNL